MSASPSSQIDSPSRIIKADTITERERLTSNIGVITKDKIDPPKKNDNNTSKGNKPRAI